MVSCLNVFVGKTDDSVQKDLIHLSSNSVPPFWPHVWNNDELKSEVACSDPIAALITG